MNLETFDMSKNLWSLLLLPFLALAVGCPAGDDDDSSAGDDDDTAVPVIVTATNPTPDEDNYFFAAKPWARFDRAPESATMTLKDAAGAEVASTSTVTGTLMTLDPGAPLTPSAAYALEIEWAPCDGCPVTINFETGPYGNDLADPAGTLVGATYNIDLAQANFVEPPGVGPILQSQIGDIAILFSMLPESDFDVAAGLQIMGALGAVVDPVNGIIEQEICTETLAFTAGPDGEIGTADDTPAGWNNPNLELGPTNLDISVQGIQATIQDLVITGTFHPDGDDMRGGTFAGKVDTRPLAPELDPEGGEGAVCDLVEETIGISCEACNDDGTEVFCLSVLADNIVAEKVDGLTLEAESCATIIADYVADNAMCADEAAAYDEDGDGTYELCPAYVP
jgi:hypothetical protein